VTEVDHAVHVEREAMRGRSWPRGWLLRRGLLSADLVGLILAFSMAEALYGGPAHRRAFGLGGEIVLFILTLPVWIVLAKLYGLYDRDETRTDHKTSDDLMGVLHLATVGTWVVFAGSRLLNVSGTDLRRVAVFWALAIAGIVTARSIARAVCRRHASYVQHTLVVGSSPTAWMIANKIDQNPRSGLRLIGLVDPAGADSELPRSPATIGTVDDLMQLVDEHDIGRVVVVASEAEETELLDQMRELNRRGVQVDVLPQYYALLGPEVDVHMAGGVPLWSIRPFRMSRSSLLIKRTFDVVISSISVALLAPVFLMIAGIIRLSSGGPSFFGQIRIGERQRPFRIWKFRTMVVDAEERKSELARRNIHVQPGQDGVMFKVVDDPRVTRIGRFLRRFSLDELPQLINVLRGDMSLVGPRPLIPDEHDQVRDWQRRRVDLKPGITGLWQANGRSALPFDEMVELDYRYVTNWSLGRDVQLILQTIPQVIRGAGPAL
jgi:exopolysaccharide biosynthesis polyprenyl glycosylphosphotransferase